MKRPKIPWDNYIMRKYGLGIRREIFRAHEPFIRVVQAQRLADKAALMCKEAGNA